jgi:hypothetical protein
MLCGAVRVKQRVTVRQHHCLTTPRTPQQGTAHIGKPWLSYTSQQDNDLLLEAIAVLRTLTTAYVRETQLSRAWYKHIVYTQGDN